MNRADFSRVDLNNPDWFLGAIAEARWVCLKKERPRAWALAVDYAVITEDLEVVPRVISWKVSEGQEKASDEQVADIFVMFQRSRQAMYNSAVEMIQSGRTSDGIRISKIVAPEVAVAYSQAAQKVEHGGFKFDDLNCEIVQDIADAGNPNRWGLRHVPTRTTVYFNVNKSLMRMTAKECQAMVQGAIRRLAAEVKAKTGRRLTGGAEAKEHARGGR